MKKILSLSILVLSTSTVWATPIEGKWQGACYGVSQGYMQDSLSFKGNEFTFKSYHYGSAKCDDPNIDVESTGTFTEVSIDESEDGIKAVDFTSGPSYMTPLTGAMAFSMNIAGVCGIKNWKNKQKRDISGKVCDGEQIPTVGQVRYDIYGIEGSTLYTGAITPEHDATTPENRPIELQSDRPMQSVN